ncbi:MAG TPA: hypothetical protein VM008_00060 [Phycisphaerae bacterium]|nr:hypothetical protein [Phycisphaerae bacterium]
MIPGISKPPISHRRKAVAIMIAGSADFLQIILFPFFGISYLFDDAIDFAAAILLTAVCGFKWQFILAFAAELVPGLDLLPTWSAVALLIPSIPDQSELTASGGTTAARKYPVIEGTAVVIPPVQQPKPPPFPTTPSP